jgi:hypothetical protein
VSDFSGLPPAEVERPRAWRMVAAAALVVSVLAILLVGFVVWVLWETFSVDFSL